MNYSIKMDKELKNSILKTGTTILGIVCKDGVVMASDRRSSVGQIIYTKDSEKTKILNDYLVFSGCGSATEVQKIAQLLKAELRLKELKSKSRPTVKQSASLLSNIQVQASAFILAGLDEDGETSLYDILGGHLNKVKDYTASIGSGMPYVLGLLERQYKKDISVKEAVEVAKEALKSSTQRDVGSGNGIDIFTITKQGIKKVVEQTIEPDYKNDKKEK
ncbi:MAG: proteasome subunit beta [Nanoarchaeota archaeon]|jgi:proteasome beta subunit